MLIQIIKTPITRFQLSQIAKERFGDLIKAAVDIEQGIMAVGGELHVDEQIVLIEKEKSKQENVWGVNLYPEKEGDDFIEFDSMVNIKPALGNRSRGIDSPEIKEKILAVVGKLIK